MSRKTYFGKSNILGKGVFAARDLKKGETAFVAKGKLRKFMVHNKEDSLFGPNWMSVSPNIWLDPRENNALNFINHSCDPNLGVRGKITFVALRDIKAGEELTVDYSIIELDPLWEMKCKCGSKNCRKIIKSLNHLSPKTLKRYIPYVPAHFLRVYNKISK